MYCFAVAEIGICNPYTATLFEAMAKFEAIQSGLINSTGAIVSTKKIKGKWSYYRSFMAWME